MAHKKVIIARRGKRVGYVYEDGSVANTGGRYSGTLQGSLVNNPLSMRARQGVLVRSGKFKKLGPPY